MYNKIMQYLKLMRVHHYIKNILIFLPVIFSGNLFDLFMIRNIIIGFATFSFTSSAIYIINDIKDREKDRLHMIKCNRPIASGKVQIREAVILAAVLMVFAMICCFFVSREHGILSWVLLLIYFLSNLLYSIELKNIPILDIAILVSGFILRVFFGAAITGIKLSNWLYLTILAISFYLALGKRRNEIVKSGKKSRKVLEYYNEKFLDKNMHVYLSCAIIFYSLWASEGEYITENYKIWTVPFVMIIMLRYSYMVENDSMGDPIDVILSDRVIIILALCYGIFILGILYVL